jgi:Tfp pilus assembly protein PilZ
MATVQIFGERRLHQRKECAFAVTIRDKKSAYPAFMRNLSLGGAFIELPIERKPRVGQKLFITIPFRLKKETTTIRGRIDRVSDGFMGVRFLATAR